MAAGMLLPPLAAGFWVSRWTAGWIRPATLRGFVLGLSGIAAAALIHQSV
jgi:hypothetical protein